MRNRASAKEKRRNGSKKTVRLILCISTLLIFAACLCSHCAFAFNPALEQKSKISSQEKSFFTLGEAQRVALDNGMVVLLKEDHNLPLVSLFLCVLSGSAQEEQFSNYGMSHLIEHMLFKGTAKRGVGEIFKEIESYGGEINAFTSYDYTGYKITVPSEFTPFALEILADMATDAIFDPEEFKKEKQVVLKEIKLSYDSPQRHGAKLLWQTAFSTHPYKYPILGEEHLFETLTRKDVVDFYQKHYLPQNMVLAIVGDIEPESTLSVIKNAFKHSSEKFKPSLTAGPEPKQKKLRKLEERFTTGLTYLLLGFHSVAITDADCFALDVLATILGEGESSRLYQLICYKKKLAYSLGTMNYTLRHPGLFIITTLLEEAQRKRVLSLILNQIELIKKKLVSDEELENAKNKIISDIVFSQQTLEARAKDLALNEGITGDFRFTEKYIQKIKQVTSEDIRQVANNYLQKQGLSIVALTPRQEADQAKPLQGSSEPFEMGIENLTLKTTALHSTGISQDVQRYVLDNGLTLLVRENKELPLVSIKAVFKGGLRAEDESSNGLCNLVAKMLDKGTESKNTVEIAYSVESQGARLSSFSGNNSFGLSLDLLSKDFDQMLMLLADLLINSSFPQKEVKAQKKKNLALIKAQEDDIFKSGTKLLKATIFQKHPYRFPVIGDQRSLANLQREDLINFYRKFCVGKNMVLAVFGDVETEEVLAKVKQAFAGIVPGEIPRLVVPPEPRQTAMHASFKSMPKSQTLVLMGFPGTTVENQDRYALELTCEILSQTSGRLFTQIREKAGLAYTLGAYQVLGLDPGYLVIYVATTAENAQTIKKQILQQLDLLKNQALTEKELAQAKTAVLGKRLIEYQTNSASAMESALDELYGLGCNHYLKYAAEINSVTSAEITKCAKQYFSLDNYAVVVLGPSPE